MKFTHRLFNFLGNSESRQKADEIQEILEKDLGDQVLDLDVKWKDGIVELSGKCATPVARERMITLANYFENVEKVIANKLEIRRK